MHSSAQRYNTCAQSASPLSSHPPQLAQPTGISMKNRLAMHDATLGSEIQPTPAGSESGMGMGKKRGKREKKKKRGGKEVSVAHLTDVWKEVLNLLHVRTSSVSFLVNDFSTQRPSAAQ